MTVQTNAGTKLGIVLATPATNDIAGFDALTFISVGEVVGIGDHGAVYASVTHNPLDSRRTQKFKGSVNDGSLALDLGMEIADVGQAILLEGADGAPSAVDAIHSVELIFQDLSKEFFQVKIMSYTRNPGTIDQIIGATVTLELLDKIVDKPAP